MIQISRISLTEAGKLLLEHCERILEDYKRLEYEMHLLHNEYTGGLKLSKTVIPFCTSSSSGLGESGELLAELAGTGDWQEGMRFRSSVSEGDVQEWLDSLSLS